MAISPQRLTIYLYSAHRAVTFAVAQLSCCIYICCFIAGFDYRTRLVSNQTRHSAYRLHHDASHSIIVVTSHNRSFSHQPAVVRWSFHDTIAAFFVTRRYRQLRKNRLVCSWH